MDRILSEEKGESNSPTMNCRTRGGVRRPCESAEKRWVDMLSRDDWTWPRDNAVYFAVGERGDNFQTTNPDPEAVEEEVQLLWVAQPARFVSHNLATRTMACSHSTPHPHTLRSPLLLPLVFLAVKNIDLLVQGFFTPDHHSQGMCGIDLCISWRRDGVLDSCLQGSLD